MDPRDEAYANIAFIVGAIVGASAGAKHGCCWMIGSGILFGFLCSLATLLITEHLD